MNIIGLGTPGCKLASEFEIYSQYEVFFVDTENKKKYKNFHKIKEQSSHEEYEKNYRKINFKMKDDETTIIVASSGKISGVLLRLLEQMKNPHINILCIRPDLSSAAEKEETRDKVVFGILQQYARSRIFDKLFVVNNAQAEEVLKEISIQTYWKDINKVISSTYHMLNVFENTEAILSSLNEPTATSNICTLGVVSFDTLREKLFYKLENTRLKKYFFGITEKTLNEEKELLQKIRSFVKERASSEMRCTAGFGIYNTDYDKNYVYTSHYASFIQEEEI